MIFCPKFDSLYHDESNGYSEVKMLNYTVTEVIKEIAFHNYIQEG